MVTKVPKSFSLKHPFADSNELLDQIFSVNLF